MTFRSIRQRWLVPVVVGTLVIASCGEDLPDEIVARRAALSVRSVDVGETIVVDASDFSFAPARLDVASGRYTVLVTNTGNQAHDLTLSSQPAGTLVQPGDTISLVVDVPPEGIRFLCSIEGHLEAGMVGELSVGGNEPPPLVHAHDDHAGDMPMDDGDMPMDDGHDDDGHVDDGDMPVDDGHEDDMPMDDGHDDDGHVDDGDVPVDDGHDDDHDNDHG